MQFNYAKGRIIDTIEFISREMSEFSTDYAQRQYKEYASDNKLQKLIDRTIENILTALIEVSGTVLAENAIMADNYADVLRKTGNFFNFRDDECEILATLAIQRNRLAHRYLNFRWQVVKYYKDNENTIKKLIYAIFEYEKGKNS